MSGWTYKHQKMSVIIMTILLIISIIPICIVAGYDSASGDDYNFGAGPHLAYLATGSVWQAVKAAAETTISVWHSWQGTWFDCFVFGLHPEVFSDNAYILVPYIFLLLHIIGFLILAHHFLKVRWQLEGLYWLQIGLIFLIFELQLMPSPKNGIFWWVGCVHYIMPLFMAICGIVLGDNFLMEHRIKDFVLLSIVSILMGGVTYPAALLLPIAVFLLWLAGFVLAGKRDKRNVLLLIPFGLLMAGLISSVIAPGNAVRAASELQKEAKPAGGIVATVLGSFAMSVTEGLGSFIMDRGFILIALIMVVAITYGLYSACKDENADRYKKLFSHPLLFVLVMFCVNASVYAPKVYSGGVASSGYNDFNFLTFMVCLMASIIYVIGWMYWKMGWIRNFGGLKTDVLMIFIVLVIAYVSRHSIKSYTDYICMEYYLLGQADDYRAQMKLQRYLMQEPDVDDVVVPEINNEQGPLMHMPIVADPDNVDNYMTRIFYGKKSCRSIPRDQWMQEYGDKYAHVIGSEGD